MKVGEEIDITVIGVSGNFGLARVANFIIYTPEVKEGDFIRVRITKVNGDIVEAEHVADLQIRQDYDSEEDDGSADYPDEIMKQWED